MTGLIFVSASLHIHLLIDIGIACGMAGLAIGGWIALRQPPWALPQWMREYDQLQGRHHGRYQKHQVTSAAGRLRSWSADDTFEVPMNARDALASAFRALGEVGETLHIEHATPNVLRAVVGSGVLGMNPAAVELLVEPVSDHATKVTIRATAKEGFIKQGTAEKAIKRVIEATGWIANPR
jgi:hypothetical protein